MGSNQTWGDRWVLLRDVPWLLVAVSILLFDYLVEEVETWIKGSHESNP